MEKNDSGVALVQLTSSKTIWNQYIIIIPTLCRKVKMK